MPEGEPAPFSCHRGLGLLVLLATLTSCAKRPSSRRGRHPDTPAGVALRPVLPSKDRYLRPRPPICSRPVSEGGATSTWSIMQARQCT